MPKRATKSKVEVRYTDRAPTLIEGSTHLIIDTPSGHGFDIDIGHDFLKVRIDGIENLTVDPEGANMVTVRQRRRS